MNDRHATPTAALFLIAIVTGFSCANEPSATAPDTVTKRSAVTAATSTSPEIQQSLDDVGVRPGGTPPQQIARPSDVPASQHPGHFQNKLIAKPARAAAGTPPAPVPAAYVGKQNEYLKQWSQLEPSIAGLPAEQQEARRAALKRSVLGE